ncbi:hypothetical protein D3C85_1645580 [compost metagenome]
MSTPPHPAATACRVISTASGKAQAPVPGIMRAGGRPASSRASSSRRFSATLSELASELVPKIASPAPCSSNERQCSTKRGALGDKSALKGVRTGE